MPNYDTQRYRKIILYDVEGNVISESNPLPVDTDTEDNRQILTNVLKELKIMNLHLSILTDTTINKEEVE